MLASAQAVQDPVIAKIRTLLTTASPQLQADVHAIDLSLPAEPTPLDEPYVDPTEAMATMRQHLRSLRASVLALRGGGPAAASAQELTARALLEADQSLEKLAESYDAYDLESKGALWAESLRLTKQSKATSVEAEKVLGIPWPL